MGHVARLAVVSVVMGSFFVVLGCGSRGEDAATIPDVPIAIDDQEGGVCGMLVREQSAPRAQVIHRDGERTFFCSIGDLLVHLDAPSPHGSVRTLFVEVMRADEDLLDGDKSAHPWVPARDAAFVVGVERRGIMGEPVLVYDSLAIARHVAAAHDGARVLDIEGLKQWWHTRQGAG